MATYEIRFRFISPLARVKLLNSSHQPPQKRGDADGFCCPKRNKKHERTIEQEIVPRKTEEETRRRGQWCEMS